MSELRRPMAQDLQMRGLSERAADDKFQNTFVSRRRRRKPLLARKFCRG